MIRLATPDDLPELARLGADFHAATPYRDLPYSPESFADFCAKLMVGGVVFMSEDGMIGGVMNSPFFNASVPLVAELFWWAPKEGRALREALEAWGQERGAIGAQFSGLANDRADTVTKLFRRAGYEPAEMAFIKRFAP